MIFQDIQNMDETGSWHSTFQRLNVTARSKAGSQRVGKSPENKNYNRYRDVVPYDHSLVRLRNSDTEYINANLVKVASIGKEYILTQGPLPHTCEHFWEMVWEQNVYSIVMLNKVVEKNQLKCHQYWPLEGSLTAGDIKVTVGEEVDHNEFIIRVLEVEHLKEGGKRAVHHFHYVAWPDFGVPSSPQAFLNYLLTVQEHQSSIQGVGPPVIHCSAGIGRSGTFALIDAALTEIHETNDMMSYDVKNKLLEMRTYRAGLIQTTEQLHFSYIAILEGANMVAPAAYSAAYYSMADVDDEDEEEMHEKRKASTEHEGQPESKERRKEPIDEVTESESESESGEDEQVSLSDVIADLDDSGEYVNNKSGEAGDESNQVRDETRADNTEVKDENIGEAGDDNGEAGDDNGEAGDDNGEAGDEGKDEMGVKTNEQLRENSNWGGEENSAENSGSENVDFPELIVTGASSQTLADRVERSLEDIEADKGGTVDQERRQDGSVADPDSSTVETDSQNSGNGAGIDKQQTQQSGEVLVNSDSQSEQCKHSDHPINSKSADEIGTEEGCKGQMPSQSSICSGHFSSDFDINDSEDVISKKSDVASGSQSVEKVVNRWHCSDNEEGGDSKEPRPKRSAMRRNSLESGKRKSVTFVNGEAEVADADSAGFVDEKETESSVVRRRATEDRKRNLADKVDEIKRKMKDSEKGDDSFSSSMIGLVLCLAVAGFLYFYYR